MKILNLEKEILNIPLVISYFFQIFLSISISIFSFLIPFLIGHPQWLVGMLVNFSLFLSTLFLPLRFLIPIIIFPSLGVISRGLIFGPFTPFLIYFLPFIWLGNFILIVVFRKVFNFLKTTIETKTIISIIFASFSKFLFLFFVANIYFKLHIVPYFFLYAMGLNQLITALAGGFIMFLFLKSFLYVNK